MIDFEERRDELLEKIEEMTRRKQYKALRDILVELEPADIADLFDDLPEEMLPLLFRLLPKDAGGGRCSSEHGPRMCSEMLIRGDVQHRSSRQVLDETVSSTTPSTIVEEMPAGVVKQRAASTPTPHTRKPASTSSCAIPRISAGSADDHGVRRPASDDMHRAQGRPRPHPPHRRGQGDRQRLLCGRSRSASCWASVSLRKLILALRRRRRCRRGYHGGGCRSPSAPDGRSGGRRAQLLAATTSSPIPVVDAEDRLVGIITVDDAMDVMEAEATEDYREDGGHAARPTNPISKRACSRPSSPVSRGSSC